MGGIIDQRSNLPNLFALSSAESVYNEAPLACMATAHLRMLLKELEGRAVKGYSEVSPISLIIDNRSAIDMGAPYKNTKHTLHIECRYHYVRERVASGKHILIWIASWCQLADLATKALLAIEIISLFNYMMVTVKEEDCSVQVGVRVLHVGNLVHIVHLIV